MPTGKRQSGYTYLLMLFIVAMAGYALAGLGGSWQAATQREMRREVEFVLDAYGNALAAYRLATPDGKSYRPQRLEELLDDTRSGVRRRHLRRLYANPLSGKHDWRTRRDALGIVGLCTPGPTPQCSAAEAV